MKWWEYRFYIAVLYILDIKIAINNFYYTVIIIKVETSVAFIKFCILLSLTPKIQVHIN